MMILRETFRIMDFWSLKDPEIHVYWYRPLKKWLILCNIHINVRIYMNPSLFGGLNYLITSITCNMHYQSYAKTRTTSKPL
jgi:hypothetical protein